MGSCASGFFIALPWFFTDTIASCSGVVFVRCMYAFACMAHAVTMSMPRPRS